MKAEQNYSAERLMLNVASTLVSDFRTALDEPSFCSDLLVNIKRADLAGIRTSCPSADDTDGVYAFKAKHQMANLLKRFRFQKDLFSDSELTERAIQNFQDTQDRIRTVDWNGLSAKTQDVLQLARVYVSKVLGAYDDETHRSLCKFGRRASVGVPARKACEAARWELPISGSINQIAWFDAEMREVDCVQKYWVDQLDQCPTRTNYQEVDFLTLALVPKTFKSLRSIMPNTTIGSYMSYGLGEMIRKRLKRNGYDITTLQQRHKRLAKRASEHGMFTTADLSSASDSISVALVARLFPKDWHDVLVSSRISRVKLPNGQMVESETFCTMGIGYTFPLQTLVFLSLLKAIHFLVEGRRSRGTISVYGDDMIYINQIHGTVCDVFKELGFVINLDKTYHEGYFRESCGGDYYHGVDVRPFCPQSGQANIGPKAYEAMLYKFVNGLLTRWCEHEISETLRYLLSEIGRVAGKAKLVPCDYPDDSGIKTSLPCLYEFLQNRTDVCVPQSVGHGVFRFSYLRFYAELKEEKRHGPYLWAALNTVPRSTDYDDRRTSGAVPGKLQSLITVTANIQDQPSLLIWRKSKELTTRLITGRRVRRLFAYVTESHTGKYKRQSGTSSFWAP